MRAVYLSLLLAAIVFIAGCGSSSTGGVSASQSGSSGNGSNVVQIAVDGGPNAQSGSIYQNAAFATATVCAPGSTSSCVTIDHLLVDTGSTGLRLFQSEVQSLNLPAVDASNGSQAYDCIAFVDGAYMWGPVEQANVTLGGESASSVPIHVISDSTSNVPTSCSNGGTENVNTAAALGANGILGVGMEPTDCTYDDASVCDSSGGLTTPPSPAYYTCSGSNCTPAFVALQNQVTNPVVLFPKDNNGVIVELPASSGSEMSMTGSLVFGIGTESNNQLSSSATVLTSVCDDLTTSFDGQTFGITDASTCAGPGSFIDSGSNGLFFPNVPNIPRCSSNTPSGNLSGFYCPSSTESFSATNEGQNGASLSSSFSVANAEQLFNSMSTAPYAVQPALDGINPSGYGFDWGLPFFYGQNVYVAIDGQTQPAGAPPAPWWAY